jgi:hypothetical protein
MNCTDKSDRAGVHSLLVHGLSGETTWNLTAVIRWWTFFPGHYGSSEKAGGQRVPATRCEEP